jgi:LysR family tdc operon transcriptional activator
MQEKLPKMNQLVALQSVVQTGSINAAAKTLGMSQPAVSRTIRELEEALQVQLLVRGAEGVRLTEAGKSFAANCSLILQSLRRAQAQSLALGGKCETRVSIGVSPITARSILVPALSSLGREFPECEFHVEAGPIERHLPQLRDGTLDFAIGNAEAKLSGGDLALEPLFECPFFFVCARGSAYESARSLSELSGARWWITGEHRVMERKSSAFRALAKGQSLSTRSNTVGIQMVLRHGYLALLSTVQIRHFRDQMSIIPIRDVSVTGRYVAVRLKDMPMTSSAERLLALMHREADAYCWKL